MSLVVNGVRETPFTVIPSVVDDGSWEVASVSGASGASIASGLGTLTLPASPSSTGDGARAYIRRGPGAARPSPLPWKSDPSETSSPLICEAALRVVAFTGGFSFGGLYLNSSLATNELRISAHPDGTIESGYLGTGWGALASGSGLVYDGLDWLGLAIVGARVVTRFGRGTATEPPSSWTTLSNNDLAASFSGSYARFNQIGAYLTCYGAPGSAVTFSFGELRVRQRRIE